MTAHDAAPTPKQQRGETPKQIQFGIFFQGVNFSTIWSDPRSGSQTDFASFRRLILTAERGLFAGFFLGEGLRLREHLGRLHALDVAGRPDAQTQLAALAAITEKIGLVATQNTTYNEPATLAHRLSTLDLLSGGRAAWNIVTTDNAWTGENFRRGGYLDHADRYTHAEFFVRTARALWDASQDQPISDSRSAASWAKPGAFGVVEASDAYGELRARARLPRSPQGHPVLFQAGDSVSGRDFAAANADVVFSAHAGFEEAGEFSQDLRRRVAAAGRPEDDVKIFPGQEIILGLTEAEAREKAEWVRRSQVTPQTAIAYLEQVWQRDLSSYDPDGPLPDIDPVTDELGGTRGAMFQGARTRELVAQWRELAAAKSYSIRDLVIEVTTGRRGFIGSVQNVADTIARYAEADIVDGFNITPYLVPSGLDEIVNWLVPALQERGVYPTEYRGETLRENLGLRPPLTRR